MTLAQLASTIRMQPRRLEPGEAQRNWHRRNRRRVVAYKRAWRARVRAAGRVPT